ncbi:3-hydroxyacyl-CoA dehydrogenase NAD-binding domain-containing protein [uncultured Sulfitobacter sp.]|jgi:3-hydroxyacyl-CoA dehydrogenase|uniref:3-hydroxyacyl-CoA dehydrogenase NAD-binding domain-containing protein n=1 Tax=uncultured Sulfitobacter sp. TaxID=191468 RepID=UPI0030F9BCCE
MSNPEIVSVRFDNDVAWVTIDNPPVNATSAAVRSGLLEAVKQVQGARAAVLMCAGKTFVAGGDMSEFDATPIKPDLPDVVQAIEDSKTPFIAAMHGTVLGGGFELALGCSWRIAEQGTRFGLPEVNVGLIPGAGGTQRLPRLIGMPLSIEIAAAGRIVDAKTLQNAGGLDLVCDGNLDEAVRNFAANLPDRPLKLSELPPVSLQDIDLGSYRKTLAKKAKGQSSLLLNLEALTWATLPFDQGQSKERARHVELRSSEESKALRHAFFAERAVSKPAAINDGDPRAIERVVVVGGGLMGAGIATAVLSAGLFVTIIERDDTAATGALDRVHANLDSALKRGKIDQSRYDEQKSKFSTATTYDAASGHDLAIEAVFEDVAVKQQVFTQLASVMASDAILATNTSYLDPGEIFIGIDQPQRCVGLHFFSPAHIMKLLEVVQLPATSTDTLATSFAFAKHLRKVAVLSGVCDGFIGNRMLAAYRRAAEYMLADGALPQEIDVAMRDFGMAMGPFEAQDMSGLQIAQANRRRQDKDRSSSERYVEISDRLCDLKRFGQRSSKGWYRYEPGNRAAIPDSDVTTLIEDYSREVGVTRRSFTHQEIQETLLAVLANEGALIVEEGIAENDAAVDMVKVHGYGFPRWRGGPMHAASTFDDDRIRESLETLCAASPGSWTRAKRYD